jgi:anti-sigma regulatory factor (Ser/Thr protein kinase)
LSSVPDGLFQSGSMSRFRHAAFIYESRDDYVSRNVAFLREGLEMEEGAVVVNTRPLLGAMREALGADAGEVAFVDLESVQTRPSRTLAAYNEVYVDLLQRAPSVRAVAGVAQGPDRAEWDEWIGFEAVLNRAFEHLPAWVVCTYDGSATPDPVLEGVLQTHPEMLTGDGWRKSDEYQDAVQVLRRTARDPEPLQGLRAIPGTDDLESFQERLATELANEGVPAAKRLDMILAGREVATNALRHGGGLSAIRVGSVDGRFVCEIVDRGDGFDDPTVGYVAPRSGVGKGLWVARQLTWRIEFLRSAQGFVARVWL